jgi:hypothetical protein
VTVNFNTRKKKTKSLAPNSPLPSHLLPSSAICSHVFRLLNSFIQIERGVNLFVKKLGNTIKSANANVDGCGGGGVRSCPIHKYHT